jgi:hypothetical protein
MEETIRYMGPRRIKRSIKKTTQYQKCEGDQRNRIDYCELRLYDRFGPMRIRFRLKRKYGVSLGAKTIYRILKIHNLNVLAVQIKRKYKRFEMKHPNELVQMDTKGPF